MFTHEQEQQIEKAMEGFVLLPEEDLLKELAELRHFKDTAQGLWCVDQDPKEKPLDWIRENAFQLT